MSTTRWERASRPAIYGDAAYGSAENLTSLERRGIEATTKVQPPAAREGLFTEDHVAIDLQADTVTCPGGHTVAVRRNEVGDGVARFGDNCHTCPLQARCTTAKAGRAVTVSRHEAQLVAARTRQSDPAWRDDHRATRPKVERKLVHLLSGQSPCFNLFGRLKADLQVAWAFTRHPWPDRVEKVIRIEFEHSPGRGVAAYLGNRTAFDVYLEHTVSGGGASVSR